MRGQNNGAIRITTIGSSRMADIQKRQTKYLLSMSIRTICFISAVLASFAGLNWLWPFLIMGALILPYIAVVAANASTLHSDDLELRDTRLNKNELR